MMKSNFKFIIMIFIIIFFSMIFARFLWADREISLNSPTSFPVDI